MGKFKVRMDRNGAYYVTNNKANLLGELEVDEDTAKQLIRGGYEIDVSEALEWGHDINEIMLYYIISSSKGNICKSGEVCVYVDHYNMISCYLDSKKQYKILLDCITYTMILIELKIKLKSIEIDWGKINTNNIIKRCVNVKIYDHRSGIKNRKWEVSSIDINNIMNTLAMYLKEGKVITEISDKELSVVNGKYTAKIEYINYDIKEIYRAINKVHEHMQRICEDLRAKL